MKTVLETWKFNELADLADIIKSAEFAVKHHADVDFSDEDFPTVYVGTNNEEATQFSSAALVKTVLTDGSFVFDLQLS